MGGHQQDNANTCSQVSQRLKFRVAKIVEFFITILCGLVFVLIDCNFDWNSKIDKDANGIDNIDDSVIFDVLRIFFWIGSSTQVVFHWLLARQEHVDKLTEICKCHNPNIKKQRPESIIKTSIKLLFKKSKIADSQTVTQPTVSVCIMSLFFRICWQLLC